MQYIFCLPGPSYRDEDSPCNRVPWANIDMCVWVLDCATNFMQPHGYILCAVIHKDGQRDGEVAHEFEQPVWQVECQAS